MKPKPQVFFFSLYKNLATNCTRFLIHLEHMFCYFVDILLVFPCLQDHFHDWVPLNQNIQLALPYLQERR